MQQEPDRKDIIKALQNCSGGQWSSNDYRFVRSKNANERNAEWQHGECIVPEQENKGDSIVLT